MKYARAILRPILIAVCSTFAVLSLIFTLLLLYFDESPFAVFVDRIQFDEEIICASRKHQVPPQLLRALILRESRGNPRAVGSKGEIGLMQLLPGKTGAVAEWARIHRKPQPRREELFDVRLNLDVGAWYLGRALKRWKNYRCAEEMALAEYNAGFRRVKQWKPEKTQDDFLSRVTFPETKKYVIFIMRHYCGEYAAGIR